jgi:hypothetical protein
VPRRIPTGNAEADARDDFDQARQRQALARLARWLRGQPGDVDAILPFDEVVGALGRTGERELGLQPIRLDSIVGTVDRAGATSGFDRSFRPTSDKNRERWVRSAAAMRRGEPLEPISVYRVGDVHFVRDGHHRVSVARAAGHDVIDGYTTEVLTKAGAPADLRLGDLPLKTHERYFLERVPLNAAQRIRIDPADPSGFARLAEGAEAWGFRRMQDRGELLDRAEVGDAWFREEYEPAVAMLRDAGLVRPDESETDAYLRLGDDRYILTRSHEWDDDIIAQLRGREKRAP